METLVAENEKKYKEQFEKIKRLRIMLQDVENSMNEDQNADVEMK